MATNCIDCGSQLLPEHRFCQICGSAIGNLADNKSPSEESPPSAAPIDPHASASGQTPPRPIGLTPSPAVAPLAGSVPAPERRPARPGSQYRPKPHSPIHQPARKSISPALVISVLTLLSGFVIWTMMTYFAKRDDRNAAEQHQALGAEHDFGESGAIAMVSMNPTISASPGTTNTRTFPLRNGGTFSIDNYDGEIVIEGWDQQKVEVSIIKYGIAPDGQPHGKILFSGNDRDFKIRTAGDAGFKIAYHVKVPHSLTKLEIKQASGFVEVSQVYANFSGGVESGSITLTHVGGGATLQAPTGYITASFDQVARDIPLEFVVGRGQITLSFKGPLDAELMARTESGFISVDDYYGKGVNTRYFTNGTAGKSGGEASGQIGAGGRRLWIRVQDGIIAIKK